MTRMTDEILCIKPTFVVWTNYGMSAAKPRAGVVAAITAPEFPRERPMSARMERVLLFLTEYVRPRDHGMRTRRVRHFASLGWVLMVGARFNGLVRASTVAGLARRGLIDLHGPREFRASVDGKNAARALRRERAS